jgi:WD40 repeat protein
MSGSVARVGRMDTLDEPTLFRGHEGAIVHASFSHDERWIVTGAFDGTARVWRIDGAGDAIVLRGHARAPGGLPLPVLHAAFSPDGARIVTAGWDRTARVWRATGVGDALVLAGHTQAVLEAAFSPDGARVVTASLDGTARVFRTDKPGAALVLRGHTGAVRSAVFSPDGTRVATASDDRTARIFVLPARWDERTEHDLDARFVLRGHSSVVWQAAFSPDGARVVTASSDQTARVWPSDGVGDPLVLRGHEGVVWSASFYHDGTRVVTSSGDGTTRVWSGNPPAMPVVVRSAAQLLDAALSPDGTRAVTTHLDDTVRVYRVSAEREPRVLRGHEGPATRVVFAPDGARFASASYDQSVRVWRIDGTNPPLVLRGHESPPHLCDEAFNPDGTRLVTASGNVAHIFPADRAGDPVVLRGHTAAVESACFSPDGTRVVTASRDGTARVWSLAAAPNEAPIVLRGGGGEVAPDSHAGDIQDTVSARFSPDGARIVTALGDDSARVWRADGPSASLGGGLGAPVVLRGHTGRIRAAAFSADGTRVVTTSRDGTARVWRVDGSGPPIVVEGLGSAGSAFFAADGARIVAASSRDGLVRTSPSDGAGESVVLGGDTGFQKLAMSRNRALVAAATADGTLRIWRLLGWRDLAAALRASTPHCLTPSERARWLGEDAATAARKHARCTRNAAESFILSRETGRPGGPR